ncbi:MAG: FHA domain-containing protein [Dehalococcoidia bacterium]|nr:FHA domain-containing protein [Dehalococcoidia bacterium]
MVELLRIAIPNGEVIERHLPHHEITLGRDRANAIVVDHPSVARWHVRFVPEFAGWAVVDLQSAGGTFLDDMRLEPGVATPLEKGATLRIGEVQGILTEVAGEHTDNEPRAVQSADTFNVAVQPMDRPIKPGDFGALTVEVHNIGGTAEDFQVSVLSLPPAWVEVKPPTLYLSPGARDEVAIIIRPPRAPEARQGHHDVTISVASRLRPREERELTRVLFDGYVETTATVEPAEGPGDFVLSLLNSSNLPVAFDLHAGTDAYGVTAQIAEESVVLQPGQAQEVPIRVTGVKRPLWQPKRPHPIVVTARARDVAANHELRALRQRPPRYPWLPYVLLTAATGAVILAAWAFEWWWFES